MTKNEIGNTYNKLTVIALDGSKGNRLWWHCRCECGGEASVRSDQLRSGKTKSCGCVRRIKARKKKRTHKRDSLPNGVAAMHCLYRTYLRNAHNRGHEWRLSEDEFVDLTGRNCHYCGKEPAQVIHREWYNGDYIYNGIDRINNTKGYVARNVVSCCWNCNRLKGRRSVSEFLASVDRIYEHQHDIGAYQQP